MLLSLSPSSVALSPPFFFLYIHPSTPAPSPLSLHDALPICPLMIRVAVADDQALVRLGLRVLLESEDDIELVVVLDRKSTRLNSSHLGISYAVFCLKKKREKIKQQIQNCSHY